MRRSVRITARVVGGLLMLTARLGAGEPWTSAYVRGLPDEAFAVVAARPDGTRVRALPHHDAAGAVDGPHLRAAWARLPQLKGLDRQQMEAARRHLLEHVQARPGGLVPRERAGP
jgi:hypothetical protein